MSQGRKGKLNYRCPSCFMRDLDIDMFYDKEKDEFYCMRCQYTGNEQDVLEKNEMVRFRYRAMAKKLTCAYAVPRLTSQKLRTRTVWARHVS